MKYTKGADIFGHDCMIDLSSSYYNKVYNNAMLVECYEICHVSYSV